MTIKINTSHPKRRHHQQAFTIVELLIVIVVIGILAAITIVAYNGIRERAIADSMQSDLKNSATALEIDKTVNNTYPASASAANQGRGLQASGSNVLAYNVKPYGYCAAITNPGSTTTLVVKSITKQVVEGDCLVNVTTYAGTGTLGAGNGPVATAQFARPEGIAVGVDGALYIGDTNNHSIRKITAEGEVSTLAGSGSPGFANNTGALAQFNYPMGVAVDKDGNVYVADNTNHRIRKITPTGAVTTLAGSGTPGFADGAGGAAQFNYPAGITIDISGNLYVADTSNHRIRKITPAGVVTTLAGSGTASFANGTGTAAHFNHPEDVAVNAGGTVYVTDVVNNRIRQITSSGVVTTLAGSGVYGYADGTGAAAEFAGPGGIDVDGGGGIYVVDIDNNRIRAITASGVVTTIAGSGNATFADGIGTAASFNYARDITSTPSGVLYIADKWNNRIRQIIH